MVRFTRTAALVAGVVVAALSGTGVLAQAAPAAPPDIPPADIANRAPQAPSSDQLWAPTAATQCATSPREATAINPFRYVPRGGSSGPWRPNPTMRLLARSFDADNDAVTTEFVVQGADGASVGRARTGALPSGRRASVAIAGVLSADKPLTTQLRHGEVYRWRARAHDGGAASTFSSWCYVKIDLAPPGRVVITSPDYRSGVAGPQMGIASFTFAAERAASFEYSLWGGKVHTCSSTTKPKCVIVNGRTTVKVRLGGWGDYLTVRAKNSAGVASAPRTFLVRTWLRERTGVYTFNGRLRNEAEIPNAPEGWRSRADTLTSVDGTALSRVRGLRVEAVRGGGNIRPGGVGTCTNRASSLCALRFGDDTSEARASSIPVNTDGSFTVTAWAYLEQSSKSRSLLSATARPAEASESIEAVPHVLDMGWDAAEERYYVRVLQSDGSTVTAYDTAPEGAAGRDSRWLFLQAVSLGTWVRLDTVRLERHWSCPSCEWSYELYPGSKQRMRSPLRARGDFRVGAGPQGPWSGVIDGLMLWPTMQSNAGAANGLEHNARRLP